VWGLGFGGLAGIVALLVAAIVIGVPGCEARVARKLIRRGRGEADVDPCSVWPVSMSSMPGNDAAPWHNA